VSTVSLPTPRAVAAALFLYACSPPLAFGIDPRFPPAEQAEIRRAAADWNARTLPSVQITTQGGLWYVRRTPPASGYNGWFSRRDRLIEIHPDPEPDHLGASVYATALHEFGHALGLKHTTVGVMDPARITIVFSAEDMAECRRAGSCR